MVKDSKIKNLIALIVIIAFFVASIYIIYAYLPVNDEPVGDGPEHGGIGIDWKGSFRQASIELLTGNSPYNVTSFHNPPWILIPLIPIALLSPGLGCAVMCVVNFFAFLFVALKLKMKVLLIVVFVLFSNMIANSNNGNIEGILALGFILPPQIGLFLVLAKPQMGIAVALFWAIESWREGGVKEFLRIFLPVGIAYIISFLIFGFYFQSSMPLTDVWWNASIFPKGVPIGLILLAIAIWKREIRFAIAASPFFAPYLTGHTWAIVWLGMLSVASDFIQIEKGRLIFPKRIRL